MKKKIEWNSLPGMGEDNRFYLNDDKNTGVISAYGVDIITTRLEYALRIVRTGKNPKLKLFSGNRIVVGFAGALCKFCYIPEINVSFLVALNIENQVYVSAKIADKTLPCPIIYDGQYVFEHLADLWNMTYQYITTPGYLFEAIYQI